MVIANFFCDENFSGLLSQQLSDTWYSIASTLHAVQDYPRLLIGSVQSQ